MSKKKRPQTRKGVCPACGGLGHNDYPFSLCDQCKGTGKK